MESSQTLRSVKVIRRVCQKSSHGKSAIETIICASRVCQSSRSAPKLRASNQKSGSLTASSKIAAIEIQLESHEKIKYKPQRQP